MCNKSTFESLLKLFSNNYTLINLISMFWHYFPHMLKCQSYLDNKAEKKTRKKRIVIVAASNY